MEQNTDRSSKKHKAQQLRMELLIGSMAILTVVIIVFVFSFLGSENTGKQPNKPQQETATVIHEIRIPEDVYYSIEKKTAEVSFYNPADNHVCVMYAIALADTGKEIYRSPYLSPGEKVEQITMALELEAGDYAVDVKCEMYLESDKTPMGGTSNKRTLHVGK